jgi:hypothetical protein
VKRFTEPLHTTVDLRVDIHQHLWPEPLLRALSRRPEAPRIVRRGSGWALRLSGQPEAPLALADHDPGRRQALVGADGLDLALVAPSTPLGIESLPAGEAEPLLAAYHDGVSDLPDRFAAWAAVGLADPDPAALSRLLARGFAGACVPAGALAGPAGFDRSSAATRRCSCTQGRRGPLRPARRAGGPR